MVVGKNLERVSRGGRLLCERRSRDQQSSEQYQDRRRAQGEPPVEGRGRRTA